MWRMLDDANDGVRWRQVIQYGNPLKEQLKDEDCSE